MGLRQKMVSSVFRCRCNWTWTQSPWRVIFSRTKKGVAPKNYTQVARVNVKTIRNKQPRQISAMRARIPKADKTSVVI